MQLEHIDASNNMHNGNVNVVRISHRYIHLLHIHAPICHGMSATAGHSILTYHCTSLQG